jgi:hypothetical protein
LNISTCKSHGVLVVFWVVDAVREVPPYVEIFCARKKHAKTKYDYVPPTLCMAKYFYTHLPPLHPLLDHDAPNIIQQYFRGITTGTY